MPLLLAYSPVAQPRAGRANQNPCEVVPLYGGLAKGSSMLWQSTNGKSGLMGSRSAMGRDVNTVTMSELIFTSSAYIIPGDSPMTSVANTVAMTTLAVHTLQPLIFYNWKMNSPERSNIQVAKAPWTLRQRWCDWWTRRRAAPRRLRLRLSTRRPRPDANRRVVRRATP